MQKLPQVSIHFLPAVPYGLQLQLSVLKAYPNDIHSSFLDFPWLSSMFV